jgi:hypothetical protein
MSKEMLIILRWSMSKEITANHPTAGTHHRNYARLSGFPEYEAQMKLIFHDAQIYDVVMGRALRTVPNPAEPASVTNGRRIYDEADFQAYSLIVRTFTTANSGFVDAGGSLENDGHLLWTKLVRFNHGTSADGLPYLKAAFYDQLRFYSERGCVT